MPNTVRPGQIWQDNDPRAHGRQVRIVELTDTHALVELQVPRSAPQGASHLKPRRTRIRLDRFRPISTGYVLVQDVAE